jgi:hypothetical protein
MIVIDTVTGKLSRIEARIFNDGTGEYPWRVKLYEDGDMIDVELFRTRENAEQFINLWGYTYKEDER